MLTIIALGQRMRRDDAAGLEIVHRWQRTYAKNPGANLRIEFAGLTGLGLLALLENAEAAVLVDCVRVTDAPPGTLYCLKEEELAAFNAGSASAHGWGTAETLALGRKIGVSLPETLLILAVAAADVNMGVGLSPAVLAALPAAVLRLEEIVGGMRG